MSVRGTVRKAALDERAATRCRECGRFFRMLGRHLPAAHRMTPRDYKIKYGLPLTVGLVCADTFARISKSKQARHRSNPGLVAKMLAAKPAGRKRRTSAKPSLGAPPYRGKASRDTAVLWSQRRDDFTARWHRGDSLVTMAVHYHCTVRTIRTYRHAFGLPRRVMYFRLEGTDACKPPKP